MPRLLVAVVALALPLLVSVSPAGADSAGDILATVNNIRASHGAGPLAVDSTLTTLAQQWSAQMASRGALAEPPLTQIPRGGWTSVGSNIAVATTVANLFPVWNDPGHMANMINPAFNVTGIGTFMDGQGRLWATEFFEARTGSVPPPVTTVAPRVTVAPVTTVPRPRPTTPTSAGPPTTAPPTATTVAPVSGGPGADPLGTTVASVPEPGPDGVPQIAAAAKAKPAASHGSSHPYLVIALIGATVILLAAAGLIVYLAIGR